MFPNRDGVPPRVQRRVCAPDPFQQVGLVPYVETGEGRGWRPRLLVRRRMLLRAVDSEEGGVIQ